MPLLKALSTLSERRTETMALAAAGLFYAAAAFLPWGWPSVDGYPAVERYIDHGFLAADFYTNTTTAYNVDTQLAAALKSLQAATGVRYDVIMAAANLARCLIFPLILFNFFRAMSGDRRTALVGAVLGAGSLYALPNLFAWGWLWGDPSTAMFAVLFILAGWTYFLERRPEVAMATFTVALLIHPLMVVHGGVFAALIFFFDYSTDEKIAALKSPGAWLAGLIFVAIFVLQYLLLSGTADTRLPTDVYTHILAAVRHPTDFLPSRFSLDDWAEGIFAAAAAIIIVAKMPAAFARRRLVIAGLVSYFVICLCGWLFVEAYPVRFFVELIPFRYDIVGAPLMLLVYAVFAADDLKAGRFGAFAVIAAIFLVMTPATRIAHAQLAVSAALFFWVLLRFFTGAGRLRAIDDFAAARLSPKASILLMAGLLAALSPAAAYVRRHELVIPRAENQHPLYAWARQSTPEGAVFLVDQNGAYRFSMAIDPQRLRLVGRRAVVASKDFPFLDADMVPWNERWQTALGGGAPGFVSKADADALARIAAEFPFDYVVRDAPLDDARFPLAQKFAPAKGAAEIYVYAYQR
jgi:hypothetical protein